MGGRTIGYRFKELTGIWTGDVDGKNNPLLATGLLGSIRWWFEVLVRGLGGQACDPTEHKCQDNQHCVVCELFGCTGWARKFRFQVLAEQEQAEAKKNEPYFTLRFIELRPIRPEEWALLDCTMRLISDYGAIGGKTVLKPSDEKGRENEEHHQDYGLVQLDREPPNIPKISPAKVKEYVSTWKGRKVVNRNFSWASLQNFWFVKGRTLSREDVDKSTFNAVLGRKESKRCRDCDDVHNPSQKCPQTTPPPKRYSEHLEKHNYKISKWLAGSRGMSKKVFSFKNPPRTFGFVKPGLINLDEMKNRLNDAWGDDNFIWYNGDKIIEILLGGK